MLQAVRRAEPSYEEDYHAWVLHQAMLLRTARFAELDLENLLDEVESLARNVTRALSSNVRVLLVHLLKWRHQPEGRKGGWEASIIEHRTRLLEDLHGNPSLKGRFPSMVAGAYDAARRIAAAEMGKPPSSLPERNPFSVDQLLTDGYLPEAVESV